jgi:glycogen synthase
MAGALDRAFALYRDNPRKWKSITAKGMQVGLFTGVNLTVSSNQPASLGCFSYNTFS